MDHPTMDRQSQTVPPGDRTALRALIERAILAHAASLARAGRYAEAETVLKDALSEEASPAVLDLLARIQAQQGHWKEAEAAWTQALQLDPAGEGYKAGLRRVSQIQRRGRWPRFVVAGIVIVLVILGIIGGRSLFFPAHPAATMTPTETMTPSPTLFFSPTQTPSLTPTFSPAPTASPSPTRTVSPVPAPVLCTVSVLANVRSGAGVDNPTIGRLSAGEQVVVLGTRELEGGYRWLLVFRAPDLAGWVYSDYCK